MDHMDRFYYALFGTRPFWSLPATVPIHFHYMELNMNILMNFLFHLFLCVCF